MKSKLPTITLIPFFAATCSQAVDFKKVIAWTNDKECITLSKEDAVAFPSKTGAEVI